MRTYDFFENNDLFNHSGCYYAWYYDTKHKCFVGEIEGADERKHHLVPTPYVESFERAVRRAFWSSLTDEELLLANSFEKGPGFFDFMKETGLFGRYECAFQEVAEQVIDIWMSDNGISTLSYTIA